MSGDMFLQFIDVANDIMNKFLYMLMLLLMTMSLFLGNFFIDE